MSRMVTLLLALFPRLAMLFFLCRRPPLMWFSLVLFLLLLGVGFGPNLAPSWGCLNLISHVLICFVRSFKPSRTRLGRLFAYPLIELPNTQWTNYHGTYFSCCALVFVLYLRWSFKSTRGFCLFQEVFGRRLVFPLEGVFTCLLCTPFSPLMGRLFDH
jgi:hypothetical protein